MPGETTLAELRRLIQKTLGVPAELQRLFLGSGWGMWGLCEGEMLDEGPFQLLLAFFVNVLLGQTYLFTYQHWITMESQVLKNRSR